AESARILTVMLSPSFIVNYNCIYFSLKLSDGIVKINFLKIAKESLSIVAEREVSMFFIEARRIAIVILSSFLLAVSLNFFLINANVYASGFTGAAQLVSSVFKDFLGMQVSTGILLFLFNIPVLILGWFKVGRGFTIYSIVSVIFATVFLEILPVISLSEDIILNAVVGGVISGAGVGLSLKMTATTVDTLFIVLVLLRLLYKPIGMYFLMLYVVITSMAFILYEPRNALYTLLTLYVTTL